MKISDFTKICSEGSQVSLSSTGKTSTACAHAFECRVPDLQFCKSFCTCGFATNLCSSLSSCSTSVVASLYIPGSGMMWRFVRICVFTRIHALQGFYASSVRHSCFVWFMGVDVLARDDHTGETQMLDPEVSCP